MITRSATARVAGIRVAARCPCTGRVMPQVTPRQAEYLEMIQRLTEHYGYPPTRKELAEFLRVESTNTVHEVLVRLKDKGLVDWQPGQARTLRAPGVRLHIEEKREKRP